MLKSGFCRKKFPWAPPSVEASTSLGMGRRREAKSTCVPFYIHRILLLKQSRKISTRISPLWYLMIWCGYWKRVLWSLDLIIPVCFRLDLVHFQCGQNVARKVYVHPASRYPFFRELLFLTITIKNKYLTPNVTPMLLIYSLLFVTFPFWPCEPQITSLLYYLWMDKSWTPPNKDHLYYPR